MTDKGNLAAIILAAGHGKRMKSDLPKVLHTVGGTPLVVHVINQAKSSGAKKIVVVVGHKRELVIPVVENEKVLYAVQEEQLGTGHAAQCALDELENLQGEVIVLSGDVPLLTSETIVKLVEYHRQKNSIATMLTAIAPDPTGYGRVLRDAKGEVKGVREHKDCSEDELKIDEINSGIYLFDAELLREALKKVDNNNAQNEYYLPDVFKLYLKEGRPVAAIPGTFEEIKGINTREELEAVEVIFKKRSGIS